jgi:hypothetical protein
MKTFHSRSRDCSGQFLAEACIGLALMTFTWIIMTYSLFMANNQIRTAMAARYAAWYQGANNGTQATKGQIDQYFFFQALSTVTPQTAVQPPLISQIPVISSLLTSDGTAANGPFKVGVSFGVPDTSSTVFPFSMLKTHVPFMPNSEITNILSVNSSAQWDGIADTWPDPVAKAWEAIAVGGIASYLGK